MPTTPRRRRRWPTRTWAEASTPTLAGGAVVGRCAECGEALASRRRDAVFCSRVCQTRAWRRGRAVRRCQVCRRRLRAHARASARYCSDACRQRAARARTAQARAESIGGAA